ncbi:MAG TPA: efflux RND transporter periplasmic adaptor subunit [Ignavibacteria bacterium]
MTKFINYLILFLPFFILLSCNNKKDPNVIKASGTIETTNVTVSSKSNGQIKIITVKEGDQVKAGDVLLEIDHEMLDIQLRQSEAGTEFSDAQLKLLKSGARKEDIRQSQESVNQAKTNLDQAKQDLERMKTLYETNTVTKKQYDDAASKYDITVAQYNSSRENYNKIKTLTRPEDIESARANVKKSVANTEAIKKNIEDCKVIAPIDGFITQKYVELGENVVPSASLFKISDLKTVKLIIYVTEEELGKVKLGEKADITVDSFKDKVFSGEVIFISSEAEFTPKNIQTPEERTKLVYAVKIQIPNPQFELKSGMPADAKITLK